MTTTASGASTTAAQAAAGSALFTLAAAQFVMTLDSSVMNVSIATVAKDVDSTVTGIQTAITLYTLVMATTMITGGKVGAILGRKRAFTIGLCIYSTGSLTTALSPSLPVLILGWSVLEGLGAALIMPAVVALVASTFAVDARPRAFGLVASAGAIAVAAGPLIGGVFTTYLSWRLVFVGEVIICVLIALLARKLVDAPPDPDAGLDMVGTALSALGLGLIVLAVLQSGEWGWVRPKPGAPELIGLSPVIWMVLGGAAVVAGFLTWEQRRIDEGRPALLDPAFLRIAELKGGLVAFFFQFLVQAGLFFTIPLFLSVALGLSAIETGVRLLPLSITLLIAAVGVPKVWPTASPRTVARVGFALLFGAIVAMIGALDLGAGPEIVTVPMLLAGLGVGALASQLGAVTVSAVSDEQSGEVGGLQNTVTNLGASIGTAVAGAVLISALSSSFLLGVAESPDVPDSVVDTAETQLNGQVPFVSDADLEAGLEEAGVDAAASEAIVDQNASSRLDGLRAALAVLAVLALVALVAARRLPQHVGRGDDPAGAAAPAGG